jgi:hypothetical protein
MHCIFCCQGFGGMDLPERAHSFIQGYGFLHDLRNFHNVREDQLLRDEPPSYVRQLWQKQGISELIDNDINDDKLKRITIFKET